MENDNDQYLKVERKKWNQEALINVGCRLKNIATIKDILPKEGKHQEFMSSCFKQFHDFPKNWLFSAQIVHALLLREMKIVGTTENKLFISVGGKKARFGQREFCLVTGLRFGELSDIINNTYVANPEGIQKRYWPGEEGEDLKLATVYDRFLKRNFLEADDSLKMALLLIGNNVLFGQPYDKKITNWLFNLVDNLEAFNSIAWGHYVFKMTMHYLRHGFRSRNTKKEYGKVRYRLYGFPWAVEVWVMEAVESLINGFGMRLQDTMPRMRRWTMHKRPRNFVQTISDLEDNIRSGKEKTEVLGEGDEGDDGGDGDDGAPTKKISLKRKARKKKKKTSVKKKQRKTVTITRLNEEEDFTPGYTPTPTEDFTPGYTPTPLEDFTPGYTPTPHPLHPPQSSFRQPPPPIDSRKGPQSIVMKELPDMLENVVKREVTQLPGVLKGLMHEIGSTCGQSNEEAPLTDVRDLSLHVTKDVDATVSAEKVVTPAAEKVACGSVIVSGDLRGDYNYAAEEDRSIRVRLRSAYCISPFIDPTQASATKREQDKGKYEAFKRKLKPARLESDPENHRHSIILMSSEFFTKLNVEWKRIIEADNKAESSFDALGYECPPDWIDYGCGNRPGWGHPWWLYTQETAVKYYEKILQQVDKCSCGVFIYKYAEMAIVKKADWNWGQKEMSDFRKEIAFEIFNNNVTYKSCIDL
ncbi:hypothetical protein Dsin_008315 [Dipteronia sinensis]|uniref:DUF1985 domain-containing protein n=1 Tax=Dipteronia sinensis TaxID=43782 RepID=A0AAE0ECD6_9ROSI|nr:hypothetical protein Dsin_008315 [Dipteronia sinensis]